MKNLILACSLVFSATVNASLISTDWLNANDGLITTDTASGLDWLDLSETYGMRLADASALFGTTFAGFRFATHTEVLGFMGHAGLPTPASPFNNTVSNGNAAHIAAQQLMTSLVGETVGAGFGSTYFGSRGLVSELSALVGSYLINGTTLHVDNPCCNDGWAGAGVWLVRANRYVAAPEPTTVALLGLSVAGLGFSRRKAA